MRYSYGNDRVTVELVIMTVLTISIKPTVQSAHSALVLNTA